MVAERLLQSVKALEKFEKAAEVDIVEENYDNSTTAPGISDEELQALYQDVVRIPSQALPQITQSQEDTPLLERPSKSADLATIHALGERFAPAEEEQSVSVVEAEAEPHRMALARIHRLLSKLDGARELALSISADGNVGEAEHEPVQFVSPGLLSQREWDALLRYSISNDDAAAAELALEIGLRTDNALTEKVVNDVLTVYASRGDVVSTERVLGKYIQDGRPTPTQIHLHIKSHIRSLPPSHHPASALDVLHAYENGTLPLPTQSTSTTPQSQVSQSKVATYIVPMRTYTTLITHLFSVGTSASKVHAWDLFSHMRYVAHPVPDVHLYALMIRACAYSPSPSGAGPAHQSKGQEREQTTPYPHTPTLSGTALVGPERAMDLWTEMTMDHRLEPSKAAYDAIVLACARSGRDRKSVV